MDMKEETNQEQESSRKGLKGNALFFIIMSCWLFFFVYIGLQGGG